jgi:ABC-type Mn2+/Zn2+ transport system permease subunit
MDISFAEIWELFGLAILAALIAGLVCPLIGTFLLMRRTGFYGVVLPQLAATGVAFGFALLPWWVRHVGLGGLDLASALEDTHAAMNYHLTWAAVFTFGGLTLLLALGRERATETGRVAAAFAISSALTILFAHLSPAGEIFVRDLLRGEILAIGVHEFETLCAVFGAVLAALAWCHRDLLVVSFDRDVARVLGKRVSAWEGVLLAATGLTVSVGSMTVGPVVLFGLLVIPPLAARNLARSMRAQYLWAVAFGVGSAALGIVACFALDWPLGATIVVAAALALVPGWFARGAAG